jgi:hypothetical protein
MVPGAVGVRPYDLAAIVDPAGLGSTEGAGDIDSGERVLDIGHGRPHATGNDHPEQEQSGDSVHFNPPLCRLIWFTD